MYAEHPAVEHERTRNASALELCDGSRMIVVDVVDIMVVSQIPNPPQRVKRVEQENGPWVRRPPRSARCSASEAPASIALTGAHSQSAAPAIRQVCRGRK